MPNRRKAYTLIAAILAALPLLIAFSSPRTRTLHPAYLSGLSQPVRRVERSDSLVALTFDSGFGGDCTLEILDALAQSGTKCTFFVTGDWMRQYPDKAARIYAEGHELASHSNTHSRMAGMDVHAIDAELAGVNELITGITGAQAVLFRAPYDDWDSRLIERCTLAGMATVSYSIDAQHWHDPRAAQGRLLEMLSPGDIVLLSLSEAELAPALPELISALVEQGYAFSTVGDLLPGMALFS